MTRVNGFVKEGETIKIIIGQLETEISYSDSKVIFRGIQKMACTRAVLNEREKKTNERNLLMTEHAEATET